MAGALVVPEARGHLIAGQHRQLHVEQNEIRELFEGGGHAGQAVGGLDQAVLGLAEDVLHDLPIGGVVLDVEDEGSGQGWFYLRHLACPPGSAREW